MTERRYSDDEVAAIFEQASRAEHATPLVPAEGKGLTLAALQEIGREVGLSPEAIAQAARGLERGGRPMSRKFLSLPVGVGQTLEVNRPVSDAEWESLVAELRTT